MQSCLVLLTRCWERALQSRLHIITKSNVLGMVRNYCGTHEYQPGREICHTFIFRSIVSRAACINFMGKMQSLNCELVNQQCHKHVDIHGVPVCRVRRYPSNIKEPQREELPHIIPRMFGSCCKN